MSGRLRIFGIEFVCVVVDRDDELHAEGDDQQDGIVKFDKGLLAIADQEWIGDMRRAAMHETAHIVLRQNPALMLAFRPELTEGDLEHWLNAMSTSLVEVFGESHWEHSCGGHLLPHYEEGEE